MSGYGATLTVLATGLVEATAKDEVCGFDISAGLFGENQSEWLRQTAEMISGEKRKSEMIVLTPALPEWFCARKGGQTQNVECEHYGAAGSTCSSPTDCKHQVPF